MRQAQKACFVMFFLENFRDGVHGHTWSTLPGSTGGTGSPCGIDRREAFGDSDWEEAVGMRKHMKTLEAQGKRMEENGTDWNRLTFTFDL